MLFLHLICVVNGFALGGGYGYTVSRFLTWTFSVLLVCLLISGCLMYLVDVGLLLRWIAAWLCVWVDCCLIVAFLSWISLVCSLG